MAFKEANLKKMNADFGIRTRMILVTVFIILIVTGSLVAINYRDSITLVKETAISRAVQVKSFIQADLESHLDQYLDLANTGNTDTKLYTDIKNQMETIQGVTGAKFVYISLKTADSWIYFADGYDENHELFTPMGTPIEADYQFIYKELENKGVDIPGNYENGDFGRLMSSYFPVKNKSGEVVAVIGTDFDIEQNYQFFMKRFMLSLLFSLVMMFIAILAINGFIHRWVTKPIGIMLIATENISKGDLRVDAPSIGKGEVFRLSSAIKQMQLQLRTIASQIQQAATQVDDGSMQLSDASLALSQGANEQADAAATIVKTLESLEAATMQSALFASDGLTRTTNALSRVENGRFSASEMLDTMQKLQKAAMEMQKINKVIDDLSFQTHILALNASIEAARAGNAGKGFSVVAEEVQNLAARSSKSSKETAVLIETVFRHAKIGLEQSEMIVSNFSEIEVDVENLKSSNLEIEQFNAHQNQAVGDMSILIKQISQSIHNTSATAEETAAASEELSSQAALLNNQSHQFKL